MPLVPDCIIQMKQTTLLIRYWSFLLPKQDTRSPEMAFWSHNPATSPDHETASLFSVLEQLKRLCRRSEKTHRQALFCQLIDQKRHNQSEHLCRRSEKTHRQALFCQLVDQKRHNQSTMRRRLLACAAVRLPHRHFGCIRCITSEKWSCGGCSHQPSLRKPNCVTSTSDWRCSNCTLYYHDSRMLPNHHAPQNYKTKSFLQNERKLFLTPKKTTVISQNINEQHNKNMLCILEWC